MLLTYDEIDAAWTSSPQNNLMDYARAVERAVLEKLCAGVEMPEAVANVSASSNGCIGFVKPDKNYYTADQLRAYGAAQRLKALEDAAVVCAAEADDRGYEDAFMARLCGKAIRALKGEAA